MIQYFQLTPEILLEYVYEDDPRLNEDGINGNTKDIYNQDKPYTILLNSNAFGTKYMCFNNEIEGLDSISNLVLPLNATETQFVVAKSKYQNFFSKTNVSNMYTINDNSGYIYEDTNYDSAIRSNGKSCKVKYDKCIIHFAGRNYFGSYDSLIFQAYVYMKNKSKFYLTSFLFKKTSNLKLKSEHMLYNEKLYTTEIEFDIPSVFAIFTNSNDVNFADALKSQNIELLENTPIGINLYGAISSNIGMDGYEKLKTYKINTISIPYIYNRLDEIVINISESENGDYYEIEPQMSSSHPSIVDYIEIMGENIRAYMIMNELQLKEVWVDTNGTAHSEITHKEFHIIDINENDTDEDISNRFKAKIKYRPICTMGGLNYKAIIIDTIKIINTIDGTSYQVTSSLDIANPNKYGKRLKSLDVGNRPIVNVYNKKVIENSAKQSVIGLNKSGGFVIENKTQNITSFLESTNIGVSIIELSPEDIN